MCWSNNMEGTPALVRALTRRNTLMSPAASSHQQQHPALARTMTIGAEEWTPQQLSNLQRFFDLVDLNKDNRIDKSELQAALTKGGVMPESYSLSRMFDAVDAVDSHSRDTAPHYCSAER